jgi:hypothetical protein
MFGEMRSISRVVPAKYLILQDFRDFLARRGFRLIFTGR